MEVLDHLSIQHMQSRCLKSFVPMGPKHQGYKESHWKRIGTSPADRGRLAASLLPLANEISSLVTESSAKDK